MKELKTFIRLMIHDVEGKLVKDTGKMESHSYVLNFLTIIGGIFFGTITDGIDVTNSSETIVPDDDSNEALRADAPLGNDDYGILVGTDAGTTPEGNTNYNLDTKILHGAGVGGRLNHQAVTMVQPVVDGANVDFDVSRPFINDSGGAITVEEIGLFVSVTNPTPATFYFMILRDVTGSTVVPDGNTLTVIYTLRTTA